MDVGGIVIWEIIEMVNVVSGVYSVFLGENIFLDIFFNIIYYLGIILFGGLEFMFWVQFIFFFYVLFVVGQDNIFFFIGLVGVGMIILGVGQ